MTFFRFSFTLSVIVQCDISLSLYQTYCYAICWIFWIYSEWKYKEPLKIVICCVDISIQLNGTLHFLARLIKRNSLDYADKHVNFYHVTHLLTLTEWLKRMLSKPSKKKTKNVQCLAFRQVHCEWWKLQYKKYFFQHSTRELGTNYYDYSIVMRFFKC